MSNEIFLFDDLPNDSGSEASLIRKSEVQPSIIFFENPMVRSTTGNSSSEELPPQIFTADDHSPSDSTRDTTPSITVNAGGSSESRSSSSATTAEAHDDDLDNELEPRRRKNVRCSCNPYIVRTISIFLAILIGLLIALFLVQK